MAPWLVAIRIASHGQFFEQCHDFAAKLEGGQESHGAWPGYYLALVTISFWPAILFFAPAVGRGVLKRAEPATPVPPLLGRGVLADVRDRADQAAPLRPAGLSGARMLMAAWVLAPRDSNQPRWMPWLSWLAALQFALGLAALVAAPILAARMYGEGLPWWLMTLAGLGGAIGLVALIVYLRGAVLASFGIAAASVLGALSHDFRGRGTVARPALDQSARGRGCS